MATLWDCTRGFHVAVGHEEWELFLVKVRWINEPLQLKVQ